MNSLELTLREKIGQLVMIGFNGTSPTPELLEMIKNEKVGSIILFSRNIESAEQVAKLNRQLQLIAQENNHPNPLIIATDQENGIVRRLSTTVAEFPGNMTLGAVNDLQTTYDVSQATAKVIKSLGINMNLAPVLDCNSNPENPVIGVRSFGESAQHVATHGVEFIKGHQSAEVLTSGKHFPGHGNTYRDSHNEIPVVSSSYEELRKVELVPFIAAIKNDVVSLMVSHVHYSAIDHHEKVPASLSKNVISGLLRNELGFDGLVLTDCLEMNAVSQTVGVAEGALRALQSGADMPIISHTYSEQIKAIDRIEQAVLDGELGHDVIEKALERISKVKKGFLQWPTENENNVVTEKDITNYRSLAKSTYERGVTIVKQTYPFSAQDIKNVHAIWMLGNQRTIAEDGNDIRLSIRHLMETSDIKVSEQWLPVNFTSIVNTGDESDIVVLFTDYQQIDDEVMEIIDSSIDKRKLVVVAVKSPYVLSCFTNVQALIACYDPSECAIQACVDVIVGKYMPSGVLPVTIDV